jgi:hypothetical protein
VVDAVMAKIEVVADEAGEAVVAVAVVERT